jgi:hypothetical protein
MMMTAEEAAEAGKSLSFEKVWAAFMQTDAKMERLAREADERYKETDKLLKETAEQQKETAEQQTETDKMLKETDKMLRENARQLDKLSINVGGLNRSMGELVETLIAARLWEKFKSYNFNLNRAYQRVPIYDDTGRIRTDIDILLSNGDCAMAVEVKRELKNIEDIEYHIRRMDLIRRYPPAEIRINNKRLMGAMAGGVADPDVTAYAYECGFFVLELTGEAVQLAPPPPEFTPKMWT